MILNFCEMVTASRWKNSPKIFQLYIFSREQFQMRKHRHDLSEAVIGRYEENVKKLEDVNEKNELISRITKVVVPVTVNKNEIGQDLFNNFVKERIFERKVSVSSPLNKASPPTRKTTAEKKKSKTASGVVALKGDRALFERFLVVVLSRAEIDLKESISEFELAAFTRALFSSDGDFLHCVGKSKLMSILEGLLLDQRPDQEEAPA